jgi:hypothetical protein
MGLIGVPIDTLLVGLSRIIVEGYDLGNLLLKDGFS